MISTPPKKKLDRRQRRTRLMLSEALLSLIQEKAFSEITIQEITDRADLNRATFYLHYGTKEELLVDSLERQFDLLVQEIRESRDFMSFWEGDVVAFRHVYENRTLFKALFNDISAGYIAFRIIDYIAEFSAQEMLEHLPPDYESPIPIEIISRHVAGSLFSLLIWWLRNDFPKTPEEMAGYIQEMCMMGTAGMLIEAGIEIVNNQ